MIAVNRSDFEKHVKAHLDHVCDENGTLIIIDQENKNVVVLSEKQYNALLAELYQLKHQK